MQRLVQGEGRFPNKWGPCDQWTAVSHLSRSLFIRGEAKQATRLILWPLGSSRTFKNSDGSKTPPILPLSSESCSRPAAGTSKELLQDFWEKVGINHYKCSNCTNNQLNEHLRTQNPCLHKAILSQCSQEGWFIELVPSVPCRFATGLHLKLARSLFQI